MLHCTVGQPAPDCHDSQTHSVDNDEGLVVGLALACLDAHIQPHHAENDQKLQQTAEVSPTAVC